MAYYYFKNLLCYNNDNVFDFLKEKSALHHDRLKTKNDAIEKENQELQQSLSDTEEKVRKLESQNVKEKRVRELQLQQENERLFAEIETYRSVM